ncbi:hypothetical protein S83_013889 [Arachis hypogaea]
MYSCMLPSLRTKFWQNEYGEERRFSEKNFEGSGSTLEFVSGKRKGCSSSNCLGKIYSLIIKQVKQPIALYARIPFFYNNVCCESTTRDCSMCCQHQNALSF